MKRDLICIICPKGCGLTAQIRGAEIHVSGNGCSRGRDYAVTECTDPRRSVTTTVRVVNRCDTMVSVKTMDPVPKDRMFEVVAQLRRIAVQAPITVGDIIAPDICGSRIVATKTVD